MPLFLWSCSARPAEGALTPCIEAELLALLPQEGALVCGAPRPAAPAWRTRRSMNLNEHELRLRDIFWGVFVGFSGYLLQRVLIIRFLHRQIMTQSLESGVLEQGNIYNMQGRGSLRTRVEDSWTRPRKRLKLGCGGTWRYLEVLLLTACLVFSPAGPDHPHGRSRVPGHPARGEWVSQSSSGLLFSPSLLNTLTSHLHTSLAATHIS